MCPNSLFDFLRNPKKNETFIHQCFFAPWMTFQWRNKTATDMKKNWWTCGIIVYGWVLIELVHAFNIDKWATWHDIPSRPTPSPRNKSNRIDVSSSWAWIRWERILQSHAINGLNFFLLRRKKRNQRNEIKTSKWWVNEKKMSVKDFRRANRIEAWEYKFQIFLRRLHQKEFRRHLLFGRRKFNYATR